MHGLQVRAIWYNIFGLHQAHDVDGNILEWDEDTGTFNGEVAFTTDSEGNLIYKEATITIFEGTITVGLPEGEDIDTEMVIVNAHENEHDLNKKDIKSINDRSKGKSNRRNVERKANRIEKRVEKEIKREKENE